MIRRVYVSLLFLLVSTFTFAGEVVLNPDHPQEYTVVSGDTLWDISGKFLQYPWHWPELWSVNSHIKNPHLIYPGDLLSLVYRNGKYGLELTRGSRTYKLSPEAHEIILDKAISTIPMDVIKAFLTRPEVLDEGELAKAPYVVASKGERLISGAGDEVYVRGLTDKDITHFSLFSKGITYTDPQTEEILGYEAIYKGDARLVAAGDPATLSLKKTTQEILIGDRLLPVTDEQYEMNFLPRAPETEIEGQIISVFNGVSQVGQYQIVVLNLGERNQLEIGHVLSIYQAGNTIIDPVISGREEETYFNAGDVDRNQMVTLPDTHAGIAMVFKTFEKVSYAIIMKATTAIHINDKVSAVDQ
ncbi:MAG: peptidoglycan-binding protein [Gammaproteobacteria bacterium]|nr:MAG: peptidoglycan-binding protein [Gammaproteobacteria bacterium]